MSGRPPRPMPPKIVQEEEPEDEEEDDEDGMEEFDEMDMLGNFLVTEEGETIAMSMSGLKDAAEKIALNVEMQNKILIKIVAALQKITPCKCGEKEAPAS